MSTTIAQTTAGRVEGVRQDDLVVFKGIPFAAPPLGALRWAPPAPPEPWSDVRKADRFGPVSHQSKLPLDILPAFDVGDSMDEDCLYLNVWTPALDGARRPVLVWIHGGAFVIGSGSQTLYDGSALARRGDAVVVTVNYRLGALGFLQLAELTNGAIPATGNEGLLDQAAALEWVRDNIAAFGGDPGNVTIFGESAGGMSVGHLLALERSRGLFQKAIPQSGACSTVNRKELARAVAERVLRELDVSADDPGALRAVPPARLLEVQARLALPDAARELGVAMPFQPCIDGEVVAEVPLERVRAGATRDVALLVGTCLEEWKLFAPMDPTIASLDDAALRERVGGVVGAETAGALIESYRKAREARGDGHAPSDLFTAIETDRIFRIPAVQLAEAQRAQGGSIHSYLFTWKSPFMGGMFGACHALELGFVFGSIDASGARDFSGSGPAADALEGAMMDAWLAFARTGDPSCEALGKWPRYGESRETMILGQSCQVENDPYPAEREAWTGIERVGGL